jgi:hypothetical protein
MTCDYDITIILLYQPTYNQWITLTNKLANLGLACIFKKEVYCSQVGIDYLKNMVCKIAQIIAKWQASPILKSIHAPKKKKLLVISTLLQNIYCMWPQIVNYYLKEIQTKQS